MNEKAAIAPERTQGLHVAFAPASEPVIVPDHKLLHQEPLSEHLVHELGGAVGRELPIEWKDREECHPALRHDFALFEADGEEWRGRRWIHDLEGMRIEGDEHGAHPRGVCSCGNGAQNVEMAAVNSVEGSYGQYRAGDVRRETGVFPRLEALMHRRRPFGAASSLRCARPP